MTKGMHKLLKRCCKDWEKYMKGNMGTDAYGTDCSCGCKYFFNLEGSGDWGVCANPDSDRAGLLTWEHQGCPNGFKRGS